MLEFLNTTIGITVSDLLIVVFIFVLLAQFPLVYYWLDNRKWNPEGPIFREARKKGYPVIRKIAMNGFFKFELGQKEKKGDPIFQFDKNSNEGIRFDPRLQSGGVPKEFTVGGLEMLNYATNSPFALSSKNALAYDTILEHVRANYKQLAFLPDQRIIEYVGRSRSELPHDCKNIVQQFEVRIEVPSSVLREYRNFVTEQLRDEIMKAGEDREPTEEEIEKAFDKGVEMKKKQYQSEYLVKIFQKIQDEVINLPVKTNVYFSFVEAFQNVSTAFTAVDIQTFLQLFERIGALKNSLEGKERILIIALAIVGVIIAGAVAMNMLPARK